MSARRKLILAAIIIGVLAATWLTWPGHVLHNRVTNTPFSVLSSTLPAATIRVSKDGHATLTTENGTIALPETVRVEGGTPAVIRFENADTIPQRLGFFSVPAHSHREYTIAHPGTYSGYCSAHPAKRLTYIVTR